MNKDPEMISGQLTSARLTAQLVGRTIVHVILDSENSKMAIILDDDKALLVDAKMFGIAEAREVKNDKS